MVTDDAAGASGAKTASTVEPDDTSDVAPLADPAGSADGPTGIRAEIAGRFDRWVLPVITWTRRTLLVPIVAGVLAVVVGVSAAIAWLGADGDGLVTAGLVAVLLGAAPVGVLFFHRVLGELGRLPQTVMAAPERIGELRIELASAASEVRDLKRSGLLGLPSVFRWLRQTIGRLDAVGVAGLTAAITALHPLRLVWTLLLCWLSLIALPVAAIALVAVLLT